MLKVDIKEDASTGSICVSVLSTDEGDKPDLEIETTLSPKTLSAVFLELKSLAMAGCVMGSLEFWERLLRNR